MLTDIHTHSSFSPDGKSPLADMVAAAKAQGLRYFGVSEHFDVDTASRTLYGETTSPACFAEARRLQAAQNTENFTLLVGAEFGFAAEPAALARLNFIAETYRPDFIVNSVHVVDGIDAWFPEYFAGKSKEYAYSRYFETVRNSLDAPYPYDIVGHLGYVSRNAPYPDRKLRYADFSDVLDDILRTAIAKDKILEVNSSARGAGSAFLPDADILERYFALGGRKISYASDAHATPHILEGRNEVVSALKKIGFTHITVPVCGKHIPVGF